MWGGLRREPAAQSWWQEGGGRTVPARGPVAVVPAVKGTCASPVRWPPFLSAGSWAKSDRLSPPAWPLTNLLQVGPRPTVQAAAVPMVIIGGLILPGLATAWTWGSAFLPRLPRPAVPRSPLLFLPLDTEAPATPPSPFLCPFSSCALTRAGNTQVSALTLTFPLYPN